METNFDHIQQLWQSQKSQPFDLEGLIYGLKKTEKKQKRELIFMAIITPLTLGFIAWSLPWEESPLLLLSWLLIAIAMVGIFGLTFKAKLSKSDSSEILSNRDFIQTQIKKLKSRYTIASTYMYIYTLLLIMGLNIAYFILMEPFSTSTRIIIHISLSVAILVFMRFSIKKKIKKYDKTLKPLIEQMENLLEDSKN